MRVSKYTLAVEGAPGEHLLYHTATGAFAALDDEAFSQFQAIAAGDTTCEAVAPAAGDAPAPGGATDASATPAAGDAPAADAALAGELARAGFLTDLSPADELAAQQAAFDATRADHGALTLSFVPTYACNYRCPYCYELGHNSIKGKMDGRMMREICEFTERRFEDAKFGKLSVQWYGGDPSLALDVVEELSERLIGWCDRHDVAYDAMMITNANLIDDRAAALLARAKVSSVMLTIDGPEEVHNRRRVTADGSNSYRKNIDAARHLRAHGVEVFATMNVDKVTWPLYPEMRRKLYAEEGIVLGPGKLCDYGGCFGRAPFAEPDFDLFTHEEFALERLKQYAAEGHGADELRDLLRPIRRFCTGQLDDYYVIDLTGDVYNCDGWVGDRAHVRFNLLDGPDAWNTRDISHDPTRDAKCSACELLPVCLGSCSWERECNGWPCHPFKYTIDGYLRLYRACFEAPTEGFTQLA